LSDGNRQAAHSARLIFLLLSILFCPSSELRVIRQDCGINVEQQTWKDDVFHSDCTVGGPVLGGGNRVPLAEIAEHGSVTIIHSVFRRFDACIFKLTNAKTLSLFNVDFEGRTASRSWAVEYAKVEEIRAIDVAFTNVTGAGTIGRDGNIVDRRMMSLHNVQIEAVPLVQDLSLIRSVFHSVCADGRRVSDTKGASVFNVGTQEDCPVLRNMEIERFEVMSHAKSLFNGATDAFCLVEVSQFKDTTNTIVSGLPVYVEECSFSVSPEFHDSALVLNLGISIIGCSFHGFQTAVCQVSRKAKCWFVSLRSRTVRHAWT
jgi:hypothetical protein